MTLISHCELALKILVDKLKVQKKTETEIYGENWPTWVYLLLTTAGVIQVIKKWHTGRAELNANQHVKVMTEINGQRRDFKQQFGVVDVDGSVLPHSIMVHIPQVYTISTQQQLSISTHWNPYNLLAADFMILGVNLFVFLSFLADRTNGRTYATVLRLSVVCRRLWR